jgi:hypothetical protein
MSDDRLSISELQAQSSTDWPGARFVVFKASRGPDGYEARGPLRKTADEAQHDADAANALPGGQLSDATPALLEIARAALALQEQEQVAAKVRSVVRRAYTQRDHGMPSDAEYAAVDAEDRKLKQCKDAYLAALAKVRA